MLRCNTTPVYGVRCGVCVCEEKCSDEIGRRRGARGPARNASTTPGRRAGRGSGGHDGGGGGGGDDYIGVVPKVRRHVARDASPRWPRRGVGGYDPVSPRACAPPSARRVLQRYYQRSIIVIIIAIIIIIIIIFVRSNARRTRSLIGLAWPPEAAAEPAESSGGANPDKREPNFSCFSGGLNTPAVLSSPLGVRASPRGSITASGFRNPRNRYRLREPAAVAAAAVGLLRAYSANAFRNSPAVYFSPAAAPAPAPGSTIVSTDRRLKRVRTRRNEQCVLAKIYDTDKTWTRKTDSS